MCGSNQTINLGDLLLGSPEAIFGAHWDYEPAPNPSQEWNRQDADERLLPSWEGSGVGPFMERRMNSGISGNAPDSGGARRAIHLRRENPNPKKERR